MDENANNPQQAGDVIMAELGTDGFAVFAVLAGRMLQIPDARMEIEGEDMYTWFERHFGRNSPDLRHTVKAVLDLAMQRGYFHHDDQHFWLAEGALSDSEAMAFEHGADAFFGEPSNEDDGATI